MFVHLGRILVKIKSKKTRREVKWKKHWHGAKKDSWFSHIAVEVPGENTSNEWCEEVSDEEYNNL